MDIKRNLFSLLVISLIITSFLCFNGCKVKVPILDQPVWKADSTSTFEVGSQVRAWTIKDEGMSTILDNMQMAGVNNVYMVVVMHPEHRPYQAPEFPHNPARDSWEAEGGIVNFFPENERYGDVKPNLPTLDWLRETDWLQVFVDSVRGRGLAVGAELSHTPIPPDVVRAHSDWQQIAQNRSAPKPDRFCPNRPGPREYLIALFGDLAKNYDLDYIQTPMHLYFQDDIDKGGVCFCSHCKVKAKSQGFDLEAAGKVLANNKNAQPERDKWLAFRAWSTTDIYRAIKEEVEKVRQNPKCHIRYNDSYPYRGWNPRNLGMYIDDVSKHLGSLVNQDHEEQKGKSNETFSRRKTWLTTNRNLIGADMPLISGIAARMKATPEIVKAGIKVAIEHPAKVNGLQLKHYDGASYGLLRSFKQGMIEAGVQGLTPTLGKEFEDMALTNFVKIDDYVEEWGIETSGLGHASYVFDNPSNTYDIRITYFDEEIGHSKISLFIANDEKISFRLDENSDCWRWRLFNTIKINKGDEIKVIAESDNGEKVRLDYIEFLSVSKTDNDI